MSEAGMIGLLESGLILFLGLAAGLALDDLFVDAVAFDLRRSTKTNLSGFADFLRKV